MPLRFYLVSFDLIHARGRTNEYKAAEEALKLRFGPDNFWKPIKQFCIVRTDQGAGAIRDTLGQRLGRNCNILVVALRKGYAFRILNPQKRNEARECLEQLTET